MMSEGKLYFMIIKKIIIVTFSCVGQYNYQEKHWPRWMYNWTINLSSRHHQGVVISAGLRLVNGLSGEERTGWSQVVMIDLKGGLAHIVDRFYTSPTWAFYLLFWTVLNSDLCTAVIIRFLSYFQQGKFLHKNFFVTPIRTVSLKRPM